MTIEQANKIDGIGVDKQEGELVLLISDHLPWKDVAAHVVLLEGKLGGYVECISSGQHVEIVPQGSGLPVRIKLIHEHELTDSARLILQEVEKQLAAMDIRFSHEMLAANRSLSAK